MRFIYTLVALVFFAGTAFAAEPVVVGHVKTIKGEAYVVTGSQSVKAAVGTPVNAGSVLKTSAQSSMGVVFKDDTVMSFGPNTTLTVDEYIYAPSKGDYKLGASLAKGTLDYLSGAIAHIKPDAVSIRTPTGTIGVRGTHFAVKVD